MILLDLVCFSVIVTLLCKAWRELRGTAALARSDRDGRQRFDQKIGPALRNWFEASPQKPQQWAAYRSAAQAARRHQTDPYPVFGLVGQLIQKGKRFDLPDSYVANCVRNCTARFAPQLATLAHLRDKLAKVGLTFSAATIFFAIGVYLVTHNPDSMLELVSHGAACSATAMFGTILAAEALKRIRIAQELVRNHGHEVAWPLQLALNHRRRAGRATPVAAPVSQDNPLPSSALARQDIPSTRSDSPAAKNETVTRTDDETGQSPAISLIPENPQPPVLPPPTTEPHLNAVMLAALETEAGSATAATPSTEEAKSC